MIWRNLLRRQVRTLLTVLDISLGTGLKNVALVAIAAGLVEMLLGRGSDITRSLEEGAGS